MIYFYLFFALTSVLIASYTDLTIGKVKNQQIIISLVIWLLSLVISILTAGIDNYLSFWPYILNFLFSFLLSLFFYFTDIWAPGDIKIFLLLVLIFPFQCYSCKMGNVFPSLDIIIFSFAAGYIYLLVKSIFYPQRNSPQSSKQSFFSAEKCKFFISNVGCCCSFHLLMNYLFPEFYHSNYSLFVLLSVGLIYYADKHFHKIKYTAGFILLILFFIISVLTGYYKEQVISIIVSFLLAALLNELDSIIGKNSYAEIQGTDVRPGMILSYLTILNMQKCIDPDIPRATTESRRSRITPAQALAVQKWCKNTRRSITVVEMMPFVPLISVSVIIQIIRFFR